jgi:phosphosulfolactate synthase (CoM biosynthesis protein A)
VLNPRQCLNGGAAGHRRCSEVEAPRGLKAAARLILLGSSGGARPDMADKNVDMTRAFDSIPVNARTRKPRHKGLTEIRGPYYSAVGPRYLEDVFEIMHPYIDGLKFAGGSFALMPRAAVKRMIDITHRHDAYVSTGGWIEHVLKYGPAAVESYVHEARDLGFDVIELSVGFISLPEDDMLRLIERVTQAGLKAKPELGIQFGAGGATATAELAAEGTRDAQWVISRAKACLGAGATQIMIESEGLTENVARWRTDIVSQIVAALGTAQLMFEAADPAVFEWYVKNYGADVNLFIDHSQIVQLEALRSGIWGTRSTWGRIVTYM